MRRLRADLSGPVLAIIITVAIIAAGIGLAAYFWWLAPHASKTPTLTVVGTPALEVSSTTSNGTTTYDVHAYVTLKNDGTDSVTVEKMVLVDDNGNRVELTPSQAVTLNPGEKVAIDFSASGLSSVSFTKPSYTASIITDGGVVPVTVYVVG